MDVYETIDTTNQTIKQSTPLNLTLKNIYADKCFFFVVAVVFILLFFSLFFLFLLLLLYRQAII
ncbi:hypothetical protein K445DRAFT_218693 [Daldinia sp. EC12]|nr:hypothetical protein K445DRAFT_218693 [Daldinia sp. EC12]